tara:strand:- start:247 stop:732 length:486 start_codon:yes stop_codon:yes gene_type:complete
MTIRKKNLKFYFFLFFFFLLFYLIIKNLNNEKELITKPISLNLLTSVHPDLSWNFKPLKSKIFVTPGEVVNVEYMVENFSDKKSTGIATFAYFPNQYGSYISKLNCFCYDAQTLNPNQKEKFTLVILIDPEVTKDSKTKDIKEVTIQFTFFDYKKYKEKKI